MDEPNANTFADMALALHEEPGVQQTLRGIVEYAQQAAGCDDAGLVLLRGSGQAATAVATHVRVTKSDRLQQELREGPCIQDIWSADSFIVSDIAHDTRWPEWGPRAAALGLRSLLCIRLSTHRKTLGALNLYAHQVGAFDEDDLDVAEIFGRHAAIALASAWEEDGLRQAIGSRHLIGLAQGILMERYALDAESSFALLRRYSRDTNVKLRVIAARIVETGRLPDEPRTLENDHVELENDHVK
jgi:GAF domain-containing protein